MKKGCVYILKCANGTYYTGSTIDIEKRLRQHQAGEGVNFTPNHLPFELVHHEELPTIGQAYRCEQQLQGWSQAKIKSLVDGEIDLLSTLS